MIAKTTLDDSIIKTIRDEVKSEKNKIQVAMKYGLSYYLIKKYTMDIPTILRIHVELEQRIREELKKGKTKRRVAREVNVSRDTVIKYTRDISNMPNKNRKRSKEEITQIRKYVLKHNSKSKAARQSDTSYSRVG